MAIDKNKAIANAQRFTQKGQLDRALKEYQAIVAEDPDDVRIWLKIGDLFTKKGAVSQAVTTYDRVAGYYSERGFCLKAVAVWKQVLNIDPNYFEAHLKLAELYVQLGLAPDAIGQYQLVVGSYEREGRHRDSVLLLRKIVELSPDDIPNRIRLAEAFARQNENPKAVEEFKIVLEQLHQRERWDDAIQVGERVAYLAPDDTENLRLVSEVYLRRGDARRALARLQTCFKASPTDLPTLELLARAFAELGQVSKAVSVYRELARLHEEGDNPAARLEAFRRILALDPTDVEAISATGGGRGRVQAQQLPSQVLFTQGTTSTQGMQRLGPISQPVEVLTPEEQIRRHGSDVDLLLKYGLGEHALQTTDKILALDPEHEATLVKRKDIAIAINRRDEAIASILRLATLAESHSPDQAMVWLGEALQISPHHNEATQRMQRLSSGMAAGLRQQAVPEVAAPDDYPELDLGALDFGDDGPIEAVPTADPDGDMGSLDLDYVDERLAASSPSRFSVPANIELPLPSTVGEDDFGGLLDAGDDDFQDLLGSDDRVPSPVGVQPEPAASIDEQATPRPGTLGSEAEDEADFGGLLVGPRLTDPMAGQTATPAKAETSVGGSPVMPGLTGAPTPQPLADDFGDLGPMDLPDDDFSDLLRGEAPPEAGSAPEAADEFDFGDLGLDDKASVFDADRTPMPGSLPAATPVPATPTPVPQAESPRSEALPPAAEPAAVDEATAFNSGDLLPDDLQGVLDAAAGAAAPYESAETAAFELAPPAEAGVVALETDASAEANVDFDFDVDLDEPVEAPEAPAPLPGEGLSDLLDALDELPFGGGTPAASDESPAVEAEGDKDVAEGDIAAAEVEVDAAEGAGDGADAEIADAGAAGDSVEVEGGDAVEAEGESDAVEAAGDSAAVADRAAVEAEGESDAVEAAGDSAVVADRAAFHAAGDSAEAVGAAFEAEGEAFEAAGESDAAEAEGGEAFEAAGESDVAEAEGDTAEAEIAAAEAEIVVAATEDVAAEAEAGAAEAELVVAAAEDVATEAVAGAVEAEFVATEAVAGPVEVENEGEISVELDAPDANVPGGEAAGPAEDNFFAQFDDLGDEPPGGASAQVEADVPRAPDADLLTDAREPGRPADIDRDGPAALPEAASPAATSDVVAALSDVLGPSLSAGTPPTHAVAEAFADLAGRELDADDLAHRGTASATVQRPPISPIPITFDPEEDERGVDVEMEVASLPGVDMGLEAPEDLEPIEEIDDIELLDEDFDVVDDGEPGVRDDDETSATDAAPPPRRPMMDASTVMASVSVADIEDEMGEVDFLIEQGLAADARDIVEDLATTHGIGHPAIQRRITRILELENDTREAENAVALMSATEPTPVGSLMGATPDDLSDADVAAHFDLGVAYMEMGQYKKAIHQLQRAAGNRERRVEALRIIGLCELHQGNGQAAVKQLEDALAVPGLTRDGRIGLLYDLATAYETIGNRLAARTQLKSIVDLGAGEFLDVRERLARLG